MQGLGFYPGCSLGSSAREYGDSVKAIAEKIGTRLEEIPDWTCCGATAAHSVNRLLSVSLAARNLSLASQAGHDKILAPCAACFSRLAAARHALEKDGALKDEVASIIERPLDKLPEIVNVLGWLLDVVKEDATQWRKKDLSGLKVACYYGCLLVRPPEVVNFDDPEQPTSMEKIVSATGAEPVSWRSRLRCCGGGFSVSRTGTVLRLIREILEDARTSGADAIVVGCPMCHSNLDLRQRAAVAQGKPMPILFLSQLVGLAAGASPEALGLGHHFVDTKPLLDKVSSGKA